jgi:hypothetical protein
MSSTLAKRRRCNHFTNIVIRTDTTQRSREGPGQNYKSDTNMSRRGKKEARGSDTCAHVFRQTRRHICLFPLPCRPPVVFHPHDVRERVVLCAHTSPSAHAKQHIDSMSTKREMIYTLLTKCDGAPLIWRPGPAVQTSSREWAKRDVTRILSRENGSALLERILSRALSLCDGWNFMLVKNA